MRESSKCSGCSVVLPDLDGPTHPYMTSSAACFSVFTRILEAEYSDPKLQPTHRLTVDTYAVQHPGTDKTRRQIQSVGLHLARLCVQSKNLLPPRQTNDVMLRLGQYKSTLKHLSAPSRFSMTVADIEPYIGGSRHASKVKEWAMRTWEDWADHHDYISDWVARHLH